MLLRTRISLFGVLMVIVVSASIVFAGLKREDLIRLQYSNQVINDQLILWRNINDEMIEHMQANSGLLTTNQQLIDALKKRDSEAIHPIGEQILNQLIDANVADRIDILYPDSTLAYSSHSAVFQSPIIDIGVANTAIERGLEISGVGNDKQRNTAIIVGTPLFSDRDTTVGFGIIATDIVKALIELEKINASTVMIANRRGRLLEASDGSKWDQFSELINLREINTQQTISVGDRFYSVVILPQVANLGSLVSRLIDIKDVTEHVNQQQLVSRYTALLIVAFIFLSLLGLYVYMSRAFNPLNEGVKVLGALSKGDLHAQIEHASRKDEVGQIANAVNVFRSSLLNFNRFRRSRERQRARQERFIYREMTRLADTLDGNEREALLDELQQIDRVVRKDVAEIGSKGYADMTKAAGGEVRRSQDSDSLAMVAVAFQSMSHRVQDQYQRLREALATKEALIALRNELDIATRVQLSLLPDKIEGSNAFDVDGGMWPAKEVGGDFLDYFRLDDHRIAIAIADVSGKGVPAALFTVMTRTLLHSTVSHVESPGEVLETVNSFLEKNNDENLFVTLFYAIFDENSGRIHYANGGHNPPIVLDSKGARPLKTTDGIVLGMFGGLNFDDDTIDLEPGARLVMMTDGIPEAFNAQGEAYGDDRLLETVASLPDQDTTSDVRFIFDSVNEFVGEAPQFDDIACIVLHYFGPKDSNS